MITRYTTSVGTATLITLGLLFAMTRLIATGKPVLIDDERLVWVPYLVEPHDEDPVDTVREKPRRDVPELPPPRVAAESGADGSTRIGITDPAPPLFDHRPIGARAGPADGDLLPIVKVQPAYPPGAIRRNLEGWVVVEFTVTRNGSVEEVRAVDSSNAVFERAAVEAASRFRYRPRIIDGEAVRVTGVQNLLRFTITDGARR